MTRRHRRLHRMQFAFVRKILDGDEFAAIQLAKRGDARVHRLIKQAPAILPCDDDGTRAAIALRAAFLGAGGALFQPQPVQHG